MSSSRVQILFPNTTTFIFNINNGSILQKKNHIAIRFQIWGQKTSGSKNQAIRKQDMAHSGKTDGKHGTLFPLPSSH
jgi:hypothetical protein